MTQGLSLTDKQPQQKINTSLSQKGTSFDRQWLCSIESIQHYNGIFHQLDATVTIKSDSFYEKTTSVVTDQLINCFYQKNCVARLVLVS